MKPPSDRGLHEERTLLAWRRTAISIAVVSVMGARLLLPMISSLALTVAAAGLSAAIGMLVAAGRRYRRFCDSDVAGTPSILPDGRLPALAVAMTGVMCALGLVVVMAGSLSSGTAPAP